MQHRKDAREALAAAQRRRRERAAVANATAAAISERRASVGSATKPKQQQQQQRVSSSLSSLSTTGGIRETSRRVISSATPSDGVVPSGGGGGTTARRTTTRRVPRSTTNNAAAANTTERSNTRRSEQSRPKDPNPNITISEQILSRGVPSRTSSSTSPRDKHSGNEQDDTDGGKYDTQQQLQDYARSSPATTNSWEVVVSPPSTNTTTPSESSKIPIDISSPTMATTTPVTIKTSSIRKKTQIQEVSHPYPPPPPPQHEEEEEANDNDEKEEYRSSSSSSSPHPSYPAVTPARKVKASLVFSTAAAIASTRKEEQEQEQEQEESGYDDGYDGSSGISTGEEEDQNDDGDISYDNRSNNYDDSQNNDSDDDGRNEMEGGGRYPNSPPDSSSSSSQSSSSSHGYPSNTSDKSTESQSSFSKHHRTTTTTTRRENRRNNRYDEKEEEEKEKDEIKITKPTCSIRKDADAATLGYGISHIMSLQHQYSHTPSREVQDNYDGVVANVKNSFSNALSVAPQKQQQNDGSTTALYLAEMNGAGISQDTESIYLKYLCSNRSGDGSGDIQQQHFHDPHGIRQRIRYGDVVTIHAPSARHKALGVRLSSSPTIAATTSISSPSLVSPTVQGRNDSSSRSSKKNSYQIGFFRTLNGQAEQWLVLPPPTSSTSTKNGIGGYVQSGERLILQNELTGGALSIDSQNGGRLTLRSCLGEIEGGWHTFSSSTLSPTRRKRTVGPKESEIFQFVSAHVPPLPNWSTNITNENKRRPYLDGTHLFYPERNDILSEQVFQVTDRGQKQRKYSSNVVVASSTQNVPLHHQPIKIQEALLVEEVLGCLMGLEGNYIQATKSKNINSSNSSNDNDMIDFIIPDGLDQNITNILSKILPACSAFVKINAFTSQRQIQYEFGQVSHALCGAIDDLINEYLEVLLGLEESFRSREDDSLQSMPTLWGELQPSIRTLSILSRVVEVVKPLKGGELLNRLEEVMTNEYLGDDRAQTLFRYLLDKASEPYMKMLRGWLEGGIVKDPYGEFMIQESKSNNSDDWDVWYIVREEHVLNLMRRRNDVSSDSRRRIVGSPEDKNELSNTVLTTGKYWNAITLCDYRDERAVQLPKSPKDVKSEHITGLRYGMSDVDSARHIKREYDLASSIFLNILIRDYRMMDVLAFMKRYFLLDQGDFFVHFLDMAEDELLHEVSNVSRGRVQNWMALSIQMSSGGSSGDSDLNTTKIRNPLNDILSSLKGDFASQSLVAHLDALHATSGGIDANDPKTPSRRVYGSGNKDLTGVEAFMLDFHDIPFPLSLVLSRQTITNYQLLFRHLFFAKHVERRLVATWFDHQTIKEFQSLRKELGHTYCLRQRMLHFMQNFVYYMMFEVIEPNWLEMESKILQRDDKATKEDKYDWTSGRSKHGQQPTVDDMLMMHNHFVRRTLKECLLTNRELIQTLTKLMTTCLLFSDQMKLFMEATEIDEEQSMIATEQRQRRSRKMFDSMGPGDLKQKKVWKALEATLERRRKRKQKQVDSLSRELQTHSYRHMIARFEQVFNSNLSEFMSQLMSNSDGRYHTHLANLCVRLDYNGYVTRSMNTE